MVESYVDILGAAARADLLNGFVGGELAAVGVHQRLDRPADFLRGSLEVGEGLEVARRLIAIDGTVR